MAYYRYGHFLRQSSDRAFDAIIAPGDPASCSGLYRCEGCGREIPATQGDALPAQNHHRHLAYLGAIRWRLIVATTN